MPEWVDLSLEGDDRGALRAQQESSRLARLETGYTVTEQLEDLLPSKRVPAPPCPGFERLDAIMNIDPIGGYSDNPIEILTDFYERWQQ